MVFVIILFEGGLGILFGELRLVVVLVVVLVTFGSVLIVGVVVVGV